MREFDKRSPSVIILLIFIIFSVSNVLILLGENWCWSLLRLKGSPRTSSEAMALGMHVRGVCPDYKIEFKLFLSPAFDSLDDILKLDPSNGSSSAVLSLVYLFFDRLQNEILGFLWILVCIHLIYVFLKYKLLLVENFIANVFKIYYTINRRAANFPSIFFFSLLVLSLLLFLHWIFHHSLFQEAVW